MADVLAKIWHNYASVLGTVNRAIASALEKQGRIVSRRPWLTISIVLVLVAACCAGWARIRTESDSDKLWVPQNSPPMRHRDFVQDNYGSTERGAQFYGSAKAGQPQDVVQLAATWELFRLHEDIMKLSVPINPGWPTEPDTAVSFPDVCFRNQLGACGFNGYLQFWNTSFAQYLASVNGSGSDPAAGNRSALLADLNQLTFPDGSSASPLSIFGSPVLESRGGEGLTIDGARVVQFGYSVDKKVPDRVADAWFDKFLDLLEARRRVTTYVQLDYIAANSVDNEISASIAGDLYLVAISVAVFIVLALVFMSSWDRVNTRTSLALIGVLAVVLGIVAGYGLTMAIGLPFTSLQQTLPFILEGIGLDVVFIIVKGLDELDYMAAGLTSSQRFGRLMETAGFSVAVVAATNVVAFGLGAISEIPAIHWFCIYATICVFTNFVVLTTFFLAAFVLNERRAAANRVDCCCCMTAPAANSATPPSTAPSATGSDADEPPKLQEAVKPAAAAVPRKERSGIARRFITNWYAPWLLWWPIKALVLLAFFAYLGVSITGIYKVEQGQPIEDLCPDGSYVIDFQRINKATFDRQAGETTSLFFRDVDQSDPAIQAAMLRSLNATLHTAHINATLSAFSDNWLLGFIHWTEREHPEVELSPAGCLNPYVGLVSGALGGLADPQPIAGCVPQANFYPLLQEWLASPQGRESRNNVIQDANGTIVTSQLGAVHIAPHDEDAYTSKAYNALRRTQKRVNREIFDSSNSDEGSVFFIYSSDYIFWAGDASLPTAALHFSIYAVVGVGAVLLVLLVHPLTTLIMMAAIASVNVFLMGEMWILGLRFNSVSVVNMIMATGLAVDYAVYVAAKFTATAGGSRDERVAAALSHTGAAVALGGTAALLGTLPLAGASSAILRTFFALIFATILFSLLIGLVVLPVALSLVGPPFIPSAAGPVALDLPVTASATAQKSCGSSHAVSGGKLAAGGEQHAEPDRGMV